MTKPLKLLSIAAMASTMLATAPLSAQAGGVLRLDEVAVGELDPAIASDYADSILMFNIYDTLVLPAPGGSRPCSAPGGKLGRRRHQLHIQAARRCEIRFRQRDDSRGRGVLAGPDEGDGQGAFLPVCQCREGRGRRCFHRHIHTHQALCTLCCFTPAPADRRQADGDSQPRRGRRRDEGLGRCLPHLHQRRNRGLQDCLAQSAGRNRDGEEPGLFPRRSGSRSRYRTPSLWSGSGDRAHPDRTGRA